ncbi:hypothetical protein GEMRC1_000542 [Eukaryota sp. GEM-RC1]
MGKRGIGWIDWCIDDDGVRRRVEGYAIENYQVYNDFHPQLNLPDVCQSAPTIYPQKPFFSIKLRRSEQEYRISMNLDRDITITESADSLIFSVGDLPRAKGYFLNRNQLFSISPICQREMFDRVSSLPVTTQQLKTSVFSDLYFGEKIYDEGKTCQMFQNNQGTFVCLDEGFTVMVCSDEQNPETCLLFIDHFELDSQSEMWHSDYFCSEFQEDVFRVDVSSLSQIITFNLKNDAVSIEDDDFQILLTSNNLYYYDGDECTFASNDRYVFSEFLYAHKIGVDHVDEDKIVVINDYHCKKFTVKSNIIVHEVYYGEGFIHRHCFTTDDEYVCTDYDSPRRISGTSLFDVPSLCVIADWTIPNYFSIDWPNLSHLYFNLEEQMFSGSYDSQNQVYINGNNTYVFHENDNKCSQLVCFGLDSPDSFGSPCQWWTEWTSQENQLSQWNFNKTMITRVKDDSLCKKYLLNLHLNGVSLKMVRFKDFENIFCKDSSPILHQLITSIFLRLVRLL